MSVRVRTGQAGKKCNDDKIKSSLVTACFLTGIAAVISWPLFTAGGRLAEDAGSWLQAGMAGENGYYRLLYLLLNLGAAGIAYASFQGILRDRAAALTGSMLFVWAPYRSFLLYGNGSVREAAALACYPVLCYGLYRIVTRERGTADRWHWLWAAAGITGIVTLHVPSGIPAAGLAVIACLAMWRRTFRRHTLAALCKAFAAAALLNAWQVISYVRELQTVGADALGRRMQEHGVNLLHYLFTFFRTGGSLEEAPDGMFQSEPLGVGFAVTVGFLGFVWLMLHRDVSEAGGEEASVTDGQADFGRGMALTGMVMLLLSLRIFPWDWLQRQNRLFYLITGVLRSPVIFMGGALLCFTFAACLAVKLARGRERPEAFRWAILALAVTAFITTWYLLLR